MNTAINIETQWSSDLDWFCVDEADEIGHFATAGYKQLPQSVAASREAQASLLNFFEQLPVISTYTIDDVVSKKVGADGKPLNLNSFASMAARGLYSFDIEPHLSGNSEYCRVATPKTALKACELPEEIRGVLKKTTFRNAQLASNTRIPYIDTLSF